MSTLLIVRSSINGTNSHSNRLMDEYRARWQAANPQGTVVVRDLGSEPVPMLDAEIFGSFLTPEANRSDAQKRAVAVSDTLIDELRAADVVAIGMPMYNFGIPAQLKAWIDHVARAGVTFQYTANGPEGLLADRPVVIFSSRGGYYAETPADTETPFIRMLLNFIGIRNIEFVYAEGMALGPESSEQGLQRARERLGNLVA